MWIHTENPNPNHPACDAARRSSMRKHKTGAAIFNRKGQLISIGWSHLSQGWTNTPWSTHAEHHALIRARFSPECHTIVIVTFTKGGRFTTGLPCSNCLEMLINSPIEEVFSSCRAF